MNKKIQANRTLEAVSMLGTVNVNSRTEDTLCRCLLSSSWSWTRNFPWWNSYTRVDHEAKWHIQYWSTPVLPLQPNSQPLHQLEKFWQLFLRKSRSHGDEISAKRCNGYRLAGRNTLKTATMEVVRWSASAAWQCTLSHLWRVLWLWTVYSSTVHVFTRSSTVGLLPVAVADRATTC